MNTIIEKRKLTICALSLLLMFSLASMTAGTALRAGDSASIENINESSTNSIGHPVGNAMHTYEQIDTAHLLRHAIKIEKHHLRSRMLDEAAEEDADDEAEEDNDDGDEDDEGDQDNEDEDAEDEEEDADEENEQEEDQGDDEEEEDAEEAEDDEEEAAENDDEQEEEEDYEQEEEAQDDDQDEEEEEQDDAEEEEEEEKEEEEEEEDEEEEEKEEEEEEEDEESDDQEPQINFLKCVALTIEPNVVDVNAMVEDGEIDEDEAAQMEKTYVTKMTSNLNTQESVVFFTYGNGANNEEDQEIFMISINDWITASSGYDQICHALDEDDVDEVFSKIPSFLKSSVTQYSDHAWYAGFNCRADGTGFKSQLFLDDTCNTFSPTLNQYYPFRRSTEYYTTRVASDLTYYMTQNANGSNQGTEYCDESEFCDTVLENSVELTTCEEGDDKRRNLASYQLEYDVASSIEDACPSIQTALNIDEEYEYSNDEMEELVFLWSNTVNGGQESDRRAIVPWTDDVWLYTSGLLAVLCIATYLCCCCRTKMPSIEKTPSLDTDSTDSDTKKEPLVNNSSIDRSESDIVEVFSAIECTLSRKEMANSKKKKSKTREFRESKTRQFREFLKMSISKSDVGSEVDNNANYGSA